MKKRILTVTLMLLLLMSMAVPVFAAKEGSEKYLFYDPAYVLDDKPLEKLNEKLDKISEKQECTVSIFTTKSFDGKTATAFADDYYDNMGYGYGKDKSGIILVVNTESREWAISTCGYGITAFTDAGQEYIMDQVLPLLGEDKYEKAFNSFATLCDEFLTQAHTGEPYDSGNLPGEGINWLLCIAIGIGAGVIISFIIVSVQKSALKTVRREAFAKDYLRKGSLVIVDSSEIFMYRDLETIRKESKSSGGSSTHESSSGTTHGGSSGTF